MAPWAEQDLRPLPPTQMTRWTIRVEPLTLNVRERYPAAWAVAWRGQFWLARTFLIAIGLMSGPSA